MWSAGRAASRVQCGQESRSLTWISTPACPISTGAALFHHTRAPPSWAAIWPAHHSAHWDAWAPTMPIVSHSPGSLPSADADSRTRRPTRVGRPGHTAARAARGGEDEAGSPARIRASAPPSQPRRRRRARHAKAIEATTATSATPVQAGTRTEGSEMLERSLHRRTPAMTSTETRGAPRRRDEPVRDPRPRPEAAGQDKRRGRTRTSKTSSPRRTRVPAGSGRSLRYRRHRGRYERTRTGETPGDTRKTARPSRVDRRRCSLATEAHVSGTSPARPTVPGATTTPTSGPATQAK